MSNQMGPSMRGEDLQQSEIGLRGGRAEGDAPTLMGSGYGIRDGRYRVMEEMRVEMRAGADGDGDCGSDDGNAWKRGGCRSLAILTRTNLC